MCSMGDRRGTRHGVRPLVSLSSLPTSPTRCSSRPAARRARGLATSNGSAPSRIFPFRASFDLVTAVSPAPFPAPSAFSTGEALRVLSRRHLRARPRPRRDANAKHRPPSAERTPTYLRGSARPEPRGPEPRWWWMLATPAARARHDSSTKTRLQAVDQSSPADRRPSRSHHLSTTPPARLSRPRGSLRARLTLHKPHRRAQSIRTSRRARATAPSSRLRGHGRAAVRAALRIPLQPAMCHPIEDYPTDSARLPRIDDPRDCSSHPAAASTEKLSDLPSHRTWCSSTAGRCSMNGRIRRDAGRPHHPRAGARDRPPLRPFRRRHGAHRSGGGELMPGERTQFTDFRAVARIRLVTGAKHRHGTPREEVGVFPRVRR